jgi:hypothetical protein
MGENREYYQYVEENRMSVAVNAGWGARTQCPNGSEATSVPGRHFHIGVLARATFVDMAGLSDGRWEDMLVMRRVVGRAIKKGRGGVWAWEEENEWNNSDPDKARPRGIQKGQWVLGRWARW